VPYKPKEIVRALKSLGFIEHHQTGSHLTLKHLDGRRTVVPLHNATMGKGLFHKILKDAGVSEETFRKYI
jgi:predicted RNA binding protein YcfA (HicA-like mRNA interferase family)